MKYDTNTVMIDRAKQESFLAVAKQSLEKYETQSLRQPFISLGEFHALVSEAVSILENARPTKTEGYYEITGGK